MFRWFALSRFVRWLPLRGGTSREVGSARDRFGRESELKVARAYEESGWKLEAHRWRTRHGDVDLILSRRDAAGITWLIGVEVKALRARSHPAPPPHPELQVRPGQLERVFRSLQAHPGAKGRTQLRLDLAALSLFPDGREELKVFPGLERTLPPST